MGVTENHGNQAENANLENNMEKKGSNVQVETQVEFQGDCGPVGNQVENKEDFVSVETHVERKEDRAPGQPQLDNRGDHTTVENSAASKEGRIPEEAKEMLKSLASKWEDVLDASALQVIHLKGAMTNEVYQIKWPTKPDKSSHKVLVRIYGEGVEVFFDRESEIKTFEFMSKQGQGPLLLGRFSNGRIEEFIHARTLSASDLRDPEISPLIAAKMKEFHDLDMPGLKSVSLWDRLRNWLKTANSVCSVEEAKAFRLDAIEGEIALLEKELFGDQHIGFCHNDLQYGNIMMDEETKSITIIDYEYASYNPIAFDIANHFCEMAADYHTEVPHVLDYSKYPGLEERRRFLHAYLSASGEPTSDHELEQLLEGVEKYTLASHLFWGLWGIISEHVNEIEFDYKEYGKQRFDQYWSRKPELLGHSEATPDAVTERKEEVTAKGEDQEATKSEEASTEAAGATKDEVGTNEVVKAKPAGGWFRKFKKYMAFSRSTRK